MQALCRVPWRAPACPVFARIRGAAEACRMAYWKALKKWIINFIFQRFNNELIYGCKGADEEIKLSPKGVPF